MQSFYVYRYVDEKTKEIVYVGKTSQLFVTNRLDQHKTDNVGIWASTTPHYIEFVELPREEDMTYLESYLIRKLKPRLNIILATQIAPPFELQLDENKWKNLNEYLNEKEKAKTSQATIFANQVSLIQESNIMFNETIKRIASMINIKDKNFIKKVCFVNDLNQKSIFININELSVFDKETPTETLNRLVAYTTDSRIAGTTTDVRAVGIFDGYDIKDNKVELYLNNYIKKILEVL